MNDDLAQDCHQQGVRIVLVSLRRVSGFDVACHAGDCGAGMVNKLLAASAYAGTRVTRGTGDPQPKVTIPELRRLPSKTVSCVHPVAGG